MLSQELWKNVLEFTSVCTIRVMDTILLEDTLEMGERVAFDEETAIMKYRPVSRVFADSVLELITSVSIPQDTTESRSGRLQKLFLSRPVALQTIELFYPSDRLLQPCPLDNHVWDQLASCSNLRHLTIDQNSHLTESNLRVLSEKHGKKLLSLRFCSDISDGVLNHLPDLFPNLETLELQAKSHDQLSNTELKCSPDMSRFSRLKCLTDKGTLAASVCASLTSETCNVPLYRTVSIGRPHHHAHCMKMTLKPFYFADAELFRSVSAMRSLSLMPSLIEFHIGENENFLRKHADVAGNGFAACLTKFALISRKSPIQKLETLHICGSYLMRGMMTSIDDSLQALSRTFTNLKVLTIRYASCLLSSRENIESLSYLTALETLDLRKSEIEVLQVASNAFNQSVARTSGWCDEFLPYFPQSLKEFFVETGNIT
jgi:hypothetical protein